MIVEARQDGFSLVEVLVAFVMLAGALVISFESFGLGLRSLAAANHRKSAIDLARIEIDRLTLGRFLPDGEVTGESNGRSWRIELTAIRVEQNRFVLHPARVSFQLAGPDGRFETMLETIVLSSGEPQ